MIELRHIVKTFGAGDGAVHALQDISLTIEDGEIFGIIGLSGAGKSTLVRCINLLERPTSGSVIVDGKELTALSDRELRKARASISMIFQGFNLLMQRSVLDNVCFPMELSGVKKADARRRAMELLELVDLPDKANAYPVQLSGGQKPGRWGAIRRCCCATRPPRRWIPKPPSRSSRCSKSSTGSWA